MKEFFKNLLSTSDSVSSKRVSGLIGGLACIVICLYCTFTLAQAPAIIDTLFICSASLLGIDSITNIGKHK